MSKKKKIGFGILGTVVALVIIALVAPSPSAPPSGAGVSVKAPEDIIPLAVPSFDFIEKSDRVEPIFDGEEYSAHSFFRPTADSKFENTVDYLTINAYLFEDATSSEEMANLLLIVDSVTKIQINGEEATLTYREDIGETIVFRQQGRLVIYSLASPPIEATPPFEPTIIDEDTLKDAAIEGFKAARF